MRIKPQKVEEKKEQVQMKSVVVSKSTNNPLTEEMKNVRKEKEKQRDESDEEEEEDSSSSNE